MKKLRLTLIIFVFVLALTSLTFALAVSADKAPDITVNIDADTEVTLSDADADGFYEIGTADGLFAFAAAVNGGNTGINAILTESIDVNPGYVFGENGVTYNSESVSTGWKNWTLIGSAEGKYVGTFNGNGKTVSGLYFSSSDAKRVGFFSFVGLGGRVENLGITKSFICGESRIGAIAGENEGTVISCYNSSYVKSSYRESEGGLGGIVGRNAQGGVISHCYNTGVILGDKSSGVGGVAGYNYGEIKYCYNSGAIKDTFGFGNPQGGVVGGAYGGKILSCYSVGTLKNEQGPNGGIFGYCRYSTVENCYFDSQVAGFSSIGYVDTSRNGVSVNCAAKSSEEFKSGAVAYLLNGDQSEIVFYQTCGEGIPTFSGPRVYPQYGDSCKITGYGNTESVGISHKYVNGICTEVDGEKHYEEPVINNNVYEISNAGQLFRVAEIIKGGNDSLSARLVADIDLSGYEWTPINSFDGSFDGNYHVIRNMTVTVSGTANAGFFGNISHWTKVRAIGFENAAVTNTGTGYTGVLAGKVGQFSEVSDCYAQGTVSGADGQTAGLIADIGSSTSINNCYTSHQKVYVSADSPDKINRVYSLDSEGADAFTSGALTYKLNGDQTNIRWYQKLGDTAGAYPTFTSSGNDRVWCNCNGASVIYANNEEESTHNVIYSVSSDALVQECAVENCNHFATATLKLTDTSLIRYTGSEIMPYRADFNAHWQGERPGISYVNNLNVGTASASITAGGSTLTKNFNIEDRIIRFTTELQHLTAVEQLDSSKYTVEGLAEGHVISSMLFDVERDGFFSLDYVILDASGQDVTDNYFSVNTAHGYYHIYRAETYHNDDTSHWFTCDVEGCEVKVLKTDCSGGTVTCMQAPVCASCGNTYGEPNPDAHVWNEGTVTKAPTCTEKGEMHLVCTQNAEHTKTVEVEALGHTDADENYTCDVCGTSLPRDGLSGGAIAGIVAGSTTGAGAIGYALYWWLTKRKK